MKCVFQKTLREQASNRLPASSCLDQSQGWSLKHQAYWRFDLSAQWDGMAEMANMMGPEFSDGEVITTSAPDGGKGTIRGYAVRHPVA